MCGVLLVYQMSVHGRSPTHQKRLPVFALEKFAPRCVLNFLLNLASSTLVPHYFHNRFVKYVASTSPCLV
jgi:hypothetical protein